ncbi:nuclear transport factor 2 family protein [Paraflavitalea soli]|uniref:Nuclear transport factor 2 family protein n=1 Tax=Paraflavitalea soli TaxID=2315862 RepID=A0A3B7MKN6_9BACT|nr:nuclear transport factor 2 family protein [Paraflavitalea soli]AXY73670.1 nuclear transport factor 2 family protein [Paraflavitalea soli]
MLPEQLTDHFATEWINAWNSHQIDNILQHYADDIAFYSPMIRLLKFNEEGVIRSKDDLKKYFEIGLNAFPELHFTLHNHFTGINSVVIYYTSVNNKKVAEVFELDAHGKAIKVTCNYTMENSRY